jgi:hypothetical protein
MVIFEMLSNSYSAKLYRRLLLAWVLFVVAGIFCDSRIIERLCSCTPTYFLFNFVPPKLVYNSSYTPSIIYI